MSGHLAAISGPQTVQQPQEGFDQLATMGNTGDSWQKERDTMMEAVEVLEKHKDWADKKIGQLIKRVTEAERPQKDEAYRLRDEVRIDFSIVRFMTAHLCIMLCRTYYKSVVLLVFCQSKACSLAVQVSSRYVCGAIMIMQTPVTVCTRLLYEHASAVTT